MIAKFPEGFLWGTATAACQIETAHEHDWKGLRARDGSVLDRNIEHDLHREEDASYITQLGNAYRFNLDWSKLQRSPQGSLETKAVDDYRNFLGTLKDRQIHLMLSLHHLSNPNWFVKTGSWTSRGSVELFTDYTKKVASVFGDLVDSWCTINEPATYAGNSYLLGFFPPHRKNPFAAHRVLRNQRQAHKVSYDLLKNKFPEKMTGLSNITFDFEGEGFLGSFVAGLGDKVLCDYVPDMFQPFDFAGISYYGRIPCRPFPVTEVTTPGKLDLLGKTHDKMWEYFPEGLKKMILRFSRKYNKPIIITENGCCTDDDSFRIKSIGEHLKAVHEAMQEGADVKGYFHWSTFDNVEHHLGPGYRFGLVSVDYKTMEREMKESGKFYSRIARENCVEV